jgi:hypothetical protein
MTPGALAIPATISATRPPTSNEGTIYFRGVKPRRAMPRTAGRVGNL